MERWTSLTGFSKAPSSVPVLKNDRLYIVPTKSGLIYAATCMTILTAGAAYGNNLCYLLAFVLITIGLLTMLQTNQSLRRLRFEKIEIDDSGYSQPGNGFVWLRNLNDDRKIGVNIHLKVESDWIFGGSFEGIRPHSMERTSLSLPPLTRGKYKISSVKISSTYPLGFFYSWQYFTSDTEFFVYPNTSKEKPRLPEPTQGVTSNVENSPLSHGEDFFQLREFREGDPVSSISWKHLARSRGILTREMHGSGTTPKYLLNLELKDSDKDLQENEISKMFTSIKILEQKKPEALYQLKTFNEVTPFDHGKSHAKRCYRILAAIKNS